MSFGHFKTHVFVTLVTAMRGGVRNFGGGTGVTKNTTFETQCVVEQTLSFLLHGRVKCITSIDVGIHTRLYSTSPASPIKLAYCIMIERTRGIFIPAVRAVSASALIIHFGSQAETST
jgi:hypothetical protein